jgi:Amt family ammonium transporter
LSQFGKQAVGVGVTIVFAGVGTWVIGKIINAIWGLRTAAHVENDGLDFHVHGESGYGLEPS